MELKLYNRKGVLKLTVSPSENSSRQKRLMGDHVLGLSFVAFEYVPLEVYDYVEFEGARFWIMEEYAPKQSSTVEWNYDVKFYGIESLMRQALVLKLVDGENDPIFSLTAPAREHVALIVANINRQMDTTDWKVGEVLSTENITLDYEGTYCNEALSMLAEAAKTEFWTDGMTVNLCCCEYGDEAVLGYDNGLVSLEREAAANIKFFTRLFPIGSTRNIDPEEYGYSRLQLPDRRTYVEQNTQQGIVEHYERDAFSGIYPRRIGTLSSVRSEQRTGENGKPFTIYYVKDASLPFDPNSYEIGGLVKQISFQSGELSGRDFEVNYDTKKQEFEIITQWPYDDDTQLPGGLLIPKTGDEYILWNIRMPREYHDLAEQEFAEAVDKYLREHDQDRYVYKGRTDYVEAALRPLVFDVGQRVRLLSDEYFPGTGYRTSRITSISQNVQCPSEVDIEVSDVLAKGVFEQIDEELGEVRHYAKEVSAGLPDIIRSWENTPAADTNLYSARKSEQEFLNKRRGGTVEGPVSFRSDAAVAGTLRAAGAVAAGGPLTVGDYAAGLAGMGGRIDATGAAELESLALRRFLEVPELRYNRVDVTLGDRWSAPGAGIIEAVDRVARRITLKLEEGELGALRVGDICMGIYHNLTPSENAAADFDDGRGNRRFAGFATCYFRIVEVSGAFGEQLRYESRPASDRYASPVAPMTAMHFVAYGSFTDPARRTSRYETRTYQRYLKEVADWEFTADNIAAQFGDLSNLSLFGLDMAGYSAYLDNIYMQGVLRSLDGMFRFDALRKQLLIAGASGTGIAFDPERGMRFGSVYDPETGRFATEYDLSEIDRLQQTLAQMNDDAVFDIVEKQQIRIRWETINGTASVAATGRSGSYYHALQSAAAADGRTVFATADGELFLVRTAPQSEQYAQLLLGSSAASADLLTTTYITLRDYLAAVRLYDDEVTEGFDPRRLAELFTAYYDALDAVYKGFSDKAQRTADEARKEAAAAKAASDKAARNYTNEEIDPPTDMKVGDTWTPTNADGELLGYTMTYVDQIDGRYKWIITGDNTKTVIKNGLVTTGTVLLGDESDPAKAKAGATGAGTADDSVRFWAGSERDSMNTAPFRVTQAGKVHASDAEIAGKIDAETGSIGGLEIAAGRIGVASAGNPDDDTSSGLSLNKEYLKFSDKKVWVGFGTNVAPAVFGVPVPAIVRNRSSADDKAYGLQLDVRGAMADNIALDIVHGAIHGVRHNVRILSNAYWAYKLTDSDYEAIVNDADITVRLPAKPQKGQVFRIWKHATGNATIQSLGPTIRTLGSNSSGTIYSIPYDNHNLFELIYTGSEYLLKQYS